MPSKRYWFVLQQDVSRPIGGIKQFYLFADILAQLGIFSCIVQKTSEFTPSWFSTTKSYSTISFSEFVAKDLIYGIDILIIPETFLPIFSKFSSIQVVIFNQNMHYLHGEAFELNPAYVRSIYTSNRLLHVLTVSQPDLQFVTDCYSLTPDKVTCLVNSIDTDLFKFANPPSRSIAFMPRKNKSHSRIVCDLLLNMPWFKDSNWHFVPINNLSQSEVASTMSNCNMFLSFGYPEGFGLPLAEAFASGCYVVGYDGIGGRDICSIVSPYNVYSRIEYRDFHGFLREVRTTCQMFDNPLPSFEANLQNASKAIISRYCSANMMESVKEFLQKIDLVSTT